MVFQRLQIGMNRRQTAASINSGDIIKGSYKSISKYSDYVSKYSDSTSAREATATGSLNSMDLEQSQYGNLVAFKSASMWMQK